MTTGTVQTQLTRIFFGSADNSSTIFQMACPTGASTPPAPADQIDITCLSDAKYRRYRQGLKNSGQFSVPFNTIFRSASHQEIVRLQKLNEDELTSWMIVFSDNTGAGPTTFDSDGRLVSPGPTTMEFLGYVVDVVFETPVNDIVRGTLTVQMNGEMREDFPTADLD